MTVRSNLHTDLSGVLSVIASIYDAALTPKLWLHFMEEAFQVFGANQGTVVLVEHNNPSSAIVEAPGFNTDYLPQFYQRRDSEDYWWRAARDMPAGATFRGSDLISLRDMHKLPIYHEVAEPLGAEFMVGGVIDKGPGIAAFFSLVRSKQQADFTSNDEALIQTVLPHLRRAFLIHRNLTMVNQLRTTYEESLNQLPHGVVICDEMSMAIFVNRAAETIFCEQDGLTLVRQRLKAHDHCDNVRLHDLLSRAAVTSLGHGLSAGGATAVRRISGKRAYQVVVSPLNRCSEHRRVAPTAATIVFIHNTDVMPQLRSEALMAMFGLTNAEARVCRVLFGGSTTSEIAEELAISVNTVKTHLKQIFRKVGVSSKVELTRILSLHVAYQMRQYRS